MTINDYQDKVFETLEHIEYPSLVEEFNELDIASSLSRTIAINFRLKVSPTMCAIIIWSLTMNHQIIPQTQEATKH